MYLSDEYIENERWELKACFQPFVYARKALRLGPKGFTRTAEMENLLKLGGTLGGIVLGIHSPH